MTVTFKGQFMTSAQKLCAMYMASQSTDADRNTFSVMQCCGL